MLLFPELAYFPFLFVVFAVYWRLGLKRQNLLLLAASYIIYVSWDWRFLSLLLFSTLAGHYTAGKISSSESQDRKKFYMCASIAVNLGILGLFKYYNFFLESATTLLSYAGIHLQPVLLSLILPLGISFYTFQVLGYNIDVYRERIKPTNSLLSFAVFNAFFPQLVAGPIERAKNLLTQIESSRTFDKKQFMCGIDLLIWAFIQKTVVADNVGLYVNMIFALEDPSLWLVLAGGLGFGIQIFADFSSYTDFARGSAKLFGIELSRNFNMPFFARNPSDFWDRWHMTLTTWVKEHLYIPLMFKLKRFNTAGYAASIMIAWGLLGMWHGAGWIFILWGLYHGLLILLHHAIVKPITARIWRENIVTHALSILSTSFFMVVGFAIFRSQSTQRILDIINAATPYITIDDLNVISIVLLIYAFYTMPIMGGFLCASLVSRLGIDLERYYGFRAAAYAISLIILLAFSQTNQFDFIYFQF